MDLNELDLLREDKDKLIENPWTMLPFKHHSRLEVPIYDLVSGDFTGQICELDHKYFNTQLRRDIVAKVFHYFQVKGKKTTKLVKRVGDVAGSGKKPAPQKGRGKAR